MRHGTTVWNERGIMQGRSNNRLSKRGVELTKDIAEKFKDVQFDIIIASPLMRTIQTANIMNKYHNVRVFKDDDLLEIDQGIFTGRFKNSLSKQELEIISLRLKNAGIESYEECYNRAKHFVDNIKKKYNKENVLVVTHNCCASFIEDVITGEKVDFNNSNFVRKFKNTEVKKFVI